MKERRQVLEKNVTVIPNKIMLSETNFLKVCICMSIHFLFKLSCSCPLYMYFVLMLAVYSYVRACFCKITYDFRVLELQNVAIESKFLKFQKTVLVLSVMARYNVLPKVLCLLILIVMILPCTYCFYS